ncbi:hypothetical protein BK010_00345 [Tenericutes bacterium MO-XQ]|nr:hypothetical protein BK010_00345 [Tenericutes bacterium MO-XQ]
MDKDKIIGLTILLFIVVGIPTTIAIYWEIIATFASAIWQSVINNPTMQGLLTQMFVDKGKEYLIGNFTYFIVGILLNLLPFKINGSKAFWIIYGIFLLVLNGIIAAI